MTEHASAGRDGPALRCSLAAIAIILLAVPGVLRGQTPDTSVAVPPDTVAGAPVGFGVPERGEVVQDVLPILTPELDATGILEDVPGTFVYAFGTPGWPDAWSFYGLNPSTVALSLNGIPFGDPVTGRPRYDLLPLEFLQPLRLQQSRYGAPAAVSTWLRDFAVVRPLTELRYRAGPNGFQSIAAVHTQVRRRSLLGRPGVLGILGGYGGRAASGEYPGSRLRRERKVMVRLRYAQAGWSFELLELFNRRELGAHGGVRPSVEGVLESVYQRFGATVFDDGNTRRTVRNDLAATLRFRLLPGAEQPFGVTGYWTRQTFRYNVRADTLVARSGRVGFVASQELSLGPNNVQLRLEGWTEALGQGYAVPDSITARRNRLHAAVYDSLRLGGLDLNLEASLHAGAGSPFAAASVGASRRSGPAGLFATVSTASRPVAWVEEAGFGGFVVPPASVPWGRVQEARGGGVVRLGPFDLIATGFINEMRQPVDLYAAGREPGTLRSPDTVIVAAAGSPFRRAGATLDLGWRRDARRGIYATLQPNAIRFLNAGASALHARTAETLPDFFARARLGARFVLFRGDLDLDLYVQGRYWTAMRSRLLHPPTGLLVVPEAFSPFIGPSGTMDLGARAGIRTATVFLAYENALSGTTLLRGNMLVPVYPLPERRFRFGVYWPIAD